MSKEKLTCQNCNAEWERVSSRGRKPKLCPSCAIDSAPVPVEKVSKTIELPVSDSGPKYPGPSKWQCPNCSTKMNTEVGLIDPPVHKCPKRAMRMIVLDLVG